MEYSVQHYIDKFEKTEEWQWVSGAYNRDSRSCALAKCGFKYTYINEECIGLINLFIDHLHLGVTKVNDGDTEKYPQPTPKQRILAALYDIKAQQALTEAKGIISEQLQTSEISK